MDSYEREIRSVNVVRYLTPLREGGSLPAIVEADDGFLQVLKFRGAGQGTKALVAELIGGEIARAAGLKVPEIVFAFLDESFGRTEPDEEIQDLLKASIGLNLGIHYISGAITYDPAVMKLDSKLASKILWLDAFLTNVDRTARNTNMLTLKRDLWLIDHGACLYFHHSWDRWEEQSLNPFHKIKDHVLRYQAHHIAQANEEMKSMITEDVINKVISLIPDELLTYDAPEKMRDMYRKFLINRLHHSAIFVKEAIHAASAQF